jgi:hypothetical protein
MVFPSTPGQSYTYTFFPALLTDSPNYSHPTSWTKSDWEIFTAGTVTDTAVRDFLIDSVVKYASSGKNNVPLSDWYDASTGVTNGFQARPVVGGHLALVCPVSPTHVD